MSLLDRYVSDPKNDGTYVLWLGPESTAQLWKEVEALEAKTCPNVVVSGGTSYCALAESSVQKLREERDDAKSQLQAVLDHAVKLKELHATEGGMKMHLEQHPEISQFIAHAFASMVAASANYTEMQFEPAIANGTRITVLIQKHAGKTPHELRMEAEKERDALQNEVRRMMHGFTGFSMEEGAKMQAEFRELRKHAEALVKALVDDWNDETVHIIDAYHTAFPKEPKP